MAPKVDRPAGLQGSRRAVGLKTQSQHSDKATHVGAGSRGSSTKHASATGQTPPQNPKSSDLNNGQKTGGALLHRRYGWPKGTRSHAQHPQSSEVQVRGAPVPTWNCSRRWRGAERLTSGAPPWKGTAAELLWKAQRDCDPAIPLLGRCPRYRSRVTDRPCPALLPAAPPTASNTGQHPVSARRNGPGRRAVSREEGGPATATT